MKETFGIVIPTYGRPDNLKCTLQVLFQCETGEIPLPIPVVIVDDGSNPPIEPLLKAVEIPTTFSLTYLYQSNAGPAAARNAGYKALDTDIVLFLDDDVLLASDSLVKHYTFHTTLFKGRCAVYYGEYPPLDTPVIFQVSASDDSSVKEKSNFHLSFQGLAITLQEHIASGHLSIRKSLFPPDELPYANNLKTPVAEEYELAYRLYKRKVPIYKDSSNRGVHNIPPPTLGYFIHREYRHGMALAELMQKAPEVLELSPLPSLTRRHHPYRPILEIAWILKAIIAHTGLYKLIIWLSRRFFQHTFSSDSGWGRLLTGAALMRGIRDGLIKFKPL